jgi:apolipoprotein N-acyltransferase
MKKRILLSLLSFVLLALPWQGGPGYTLLAAFVPLFLLQDGLVGAGRRKKLWPWVLVTFLLWSLASVWWVGNSGLFMSGSIWSAIGIVLACVVVTTFVIFWPFMAYHYVRNRAPRALAYAVLISAWVGYEFVFLHGEITFPWLILGNGFANSVEAVQWYEYTGAQGGSVWVLACNIAIYEAILLWRKRRSRRVWLRPAGWIAVPLLASLVIFWTYREGENPIRVQIIQPNFDPYEKFQALTFEEQTGVILGLAGQAPAGTDYFIAPETAIDDGIREAGIGGDRYVEGVRSFLRESYPSAGFVIGATTIRFYLTATAPTHTAKGSESYWYDVYNTALRIDTTRQVGIYHKSKLVAGPEMTPYSRQFPFMKKLAMDLGGSGGYGVDSERNVFTSTSGLSVGTPICWEAVFGEYTTEFVRKGAQALFVISNDAWWGDTQGCRQLFAFSRLRAIENRRSIARSANTGISGLIDQRGRITARTGWDERVSLPGTVNANTRTTFYTRFGDIAGRVGCLVFVLSALYYIAWRRKRKDHIV